MPTGPGHTLGAMPVAYLPDLLADVPRPRVLELGGRRVTPDPWQCPSHWQRTGVDVRPGPGVDLVADAHELSRQLPADSFDALWSHAVFEHLAMPWLVALEMNRVLKTGGLAWIVTHEAFPVHEWPSDFWRFGPGAWEGLFSPATGFEILGSRPLQQARVVPDADPGAAYPGHPGCEVQLRKRGPPDPCLRWQLRAHELLGGQIYPGLLRRSVARGRRGVIKLAQRAGYRPRPRPSPDDPWRLFEGAERWHLLAGPRARELPGERLAYDGSIQAALTDVPDASLPALALLDVLQREPRPWAAVRHARRVLAPGGRLFVDSCQVAPADEPCWRLSSAAMPVLFHRASGFSLRRAEMLDPCHMLGDGFTGTEVQRAYGRTLGLAVAAGPWDHEALAWEA
ncbi:MAG: hypothetical protein DRQ55_07570 [Planctomycetota bacterium]|nr:MAG: hypothetical protein DRQ55_07570 [Planctomycetota bacterium]